MSEENSDSLDFVTTEALITELMRRHDHIVIAREVKRDDQSYNAVFDYDGSLSAALGLALRLTRTLLKYADDGETEEPQE